MSDIPWSIPDRSEPGSFKEKTLAKCEKKNALEHSGDVKFAWPWSLTNEASYSAVVLFSEQFKMSAGHHNNHLERQTLSLGGLPTSGTF